MKTRNELIYDFIKNRHYEITKDGHIFRIHKNNNRVEIGNLNSNKYRCISIIDDRGKVRRLLVHRIIWAKYGNTKLSNTLVLNHIDGNKLNNCIDNLEQVTQAENNLHRFRVLKHPPVIGNSKITKEQAEAIRELRKQGWKYKDLMKKFKVGKTTISYVVNNKIWN